MADGLDIIDLLAAKAALNIPPNTTTYDVELAQVITAASRFVDSVYGPVVRRDITRTVLAPSGSLFLNDVPVSSPTFTVTFTTVTEYSSGAATVLTAEDVDTAGTYRYVPSLGQLRRRSSWADTQWGSQEVVAVYEAGRFDATSDVDEKFREAATIALIHFWQHRGANSGAASFGGDGAPFGGVPFSSEKLREKLRSLYPEESLGPALA